MYLTSTIGWQIERKQIDSLSSNFVTSTPATKPGCRRRLCIRLLWPWPLTFWSENLIIMSPGAHTWRDFGEISSNSYTKICIHPGRCLLWPWPLSFWPQNLISTFMNPNTAVTKIGWNPLYWLVRYGVHKVFETHRLTHSLTHGRTDPKNSDVSVQQLERVTRR